ncbi:MULTISPECIES: collagen-binding domain-containing protein [Winogradskyella]|uniref:collagen-binding domain-containing protein n=2 Tax=Flavobacteriaceae TaxID=49546 RepID=UPI0015C8BF8E|nr:MULTISPECIES: collagen-binding domain-containing protein [Winogradskyella]QXP79052.1 choice-of-anchor A family protein [Winogradskyella sp. HaHa_3_26]
MKAKIVLFSLAVGSLFANVTNNLEAQTSPINPTVAANNFNVFTSGDAIAIKTESEGSWAVGGDLTLDGTLNIFGGINYYNGDSQATALVVNGKVNYNSGKLQILQSNYIKIGDLSTSAVFELDQNNVLSNTRITPIDGNFDTNPRIELSTNQTITSISGNPQIDFNEAFNQFESISNYLGNQITNVTWNADEFTQGKLWINLIPNTTNVINLTVAEFNGFSEIKFNDLVPSETTPLIINLTDISVTPDVVSIHSWPNIVGSSLSYAPYILYNFANVSSTINYTGGAQVYGTIYAPNARFNNRSNFNIDGQIIAEVFEQNSGEVHPYLFDTTIDFPPTPSEEICDGIDNNGNGVIDEGFTDTDDDGVADCIDNCPEVANPDQADLDGNGIGDVCDEPEVEEICDGIDNNGNGLIDEGFADTDGDGVADCVDNCPEVANPDQADLDGNGIGDVCEEPEVEEICDGIDNNGNGLIDEGFADTDGDGVADCIDNCPEVTNPDQADLDGNGIGDVCEEPEVEEICDGIDNNGDGVIDEGFADTDGDGVADCVDNCLYYYNPDQSDTDGDGIGDICGGAGPSYRSSLGMDVYPIPFSGTVNVKYTTSLDTSNATIEVFDIRGSILKRVNKKISKDDENSVIELDLSRESKENKILFVRFITSEGTIVKQIMSK